MYRGLGAYQVQFPRVCQSRGLTLGSSCLSRCCFLLRKVPPVAAPQQGLLSVSLDRRRAGNAQTHFAGELAQFPICCCLLLRLGFAAMLGTLLSPA